MKPQVGDEVITIDMDRGVVLEIENDFIDDFYIVGLSSGEIRTYSLKDIMTIPQKKATVKCECGSGSTSNKLYHYHWCPMDIKKVKK